MIWNTLVYIFFHFNLIYKVWSSLNWLMRSCLIELQQRTAMAFICSFFHPSPFNSSYLDQVKVWKVKGERYKVSYLHSINVKLLSNSNSIDLFSFKFCLNSLFDVNKHQKLTGHCHLSWPIKFDQEW